MNIFTQRERWSDKFLMGLDKCLLNGDVGVIAILILLH